MSSHSVRGGRKNLCQWVHRKNGKGKSRSATPNTADVVSEMLETVQGQGYRLHLGGFCSRLSLGFLVSRLVNRFQTVPWPCQLMHIYVDDKNINHPSLFAVMVGLGTLCKQSVITFFFSFSDSRKRQELEESGR